MGPHFNIKQAAVYCGYKPRTFSKVLKNYVLPFYGPKKNRLAKEVLDIWMEFPEKFKVCHKPKSRKMREVSV